MGERERAASMRVTSHLMLHWTALGGWHGTKKKWDALLEVIQPVT